VKLRPDPQPSAVASSFDPEAERAFVDAVMRKQPHHEDEFTKRIAFVAQLARARNARMGHPLTAEEVEDVVQECCLTAYRKLREYEPIQPLEHWVQGICRYVLCDAVRSKMRRRAQGVTGDTEIDEVPDRGGSAIDRWIDAVEIESLLKGMDRLTASVLRLKYLEGLTFTEVAARLGIPTNTAKTWLTRGVRKLQQMLDLPPREETT
jgi:RNA polymerase sigma-70 factor (ECF subfamily)